MKKIVTLILTVIALMHENNSNGQALENVWREDFEGSTFPPVATYGTWTLGITSANNAQCPANTSWIQGIANTKLCPGGEGTPVPAHGGTKMAGFNSAEITNGGTSELITPKLDFSGRTGYYQVSFWMFRSATTGSNEYIDVYVNTVPSSTGGNATLLGNIRRSAQQDPQLLPGQAPDNWYRYSFAVPANTTFGTNTNYIIFKTRSQKFEDMFIDDISIDQVMPCVTPISQPVSLVLSSAVSTVKGTFTASMPVAHSYLVVRTLGNASLNTPPVNGVTYAAGATLGNGTVVYADTGKAFADGNLLPNGTYTYTVYAYNNICANGPYYLTTNPLTGNATTTNAIASYSWNATQSADFQLAGNWTPARVVPDPSDRLVFNNGLADTVVNVPTQAVGRISVSGNTTVRLRGARANTLTIASDKNNTTDELRISSGSALILDGDNGLILAFSGQDGTTVVDGNLEVATNAGTANINKIDFSNSVTTINGTLAAGGTVNSGDVVFTSATTNLLINGNYIHKYTSSGGSPIPTAAWGNASGVQITGYIAASGAALSGLGQSFNDFIYNCPGQTGTMNMNLNIAAAFAVNGTFRIIATGSGSLLLASSGAYSADINNYAQTGGTLDLAGASGTNLQSLNIKGSFSQAGGNIIATNSNTTATPTPLINFAGNAGTQNVTFASVPSGRVTLNISNGSGINLTGTGGLTTYTLNTNGGIRIATRAANPINTSLIFSYASGSALTYDTIGNITMTANVLPAVNGPDNVTINVGTANVVTMPFNVTIPGTLTLTAGDLDIGINNLTIGTSPATPGSIVATGGNIRVQPNGSLIRWVTTGTLPSAANSGILFPLASGAANRNVSIYGNGSVTTGGYITVRHSAGNGLAVVGPAVTDGSYSIDKRTSSSWNIAVSNGLALAGGSTIGLRLTGGYSMNATSSANLRVMHAFSVVGNHEPSTGTAPNFTAGRNSLALSDLSGDFYIGAANADMKDVLIAVTSGDWNNTSTWFTSTVPGISDIAIINPGVNVTISAATNVVKALSVNGTLTVDNAANMLTVDSTLINNGTISISNGTLKVNGGTDAFGLTNNGTMNIGGGTVLVGTTQGYNNKPFINNGTLNVSNGVLNINGFLSSVPNSVLSQSGGNITVDGNAGTPANSVPNGTAIVSFRTNLLNLTGGTFVIANPHAYATNTFEYNMSAQQHYNASAGHTFQMGNGATTLAGSNATFAFRVNNAAFTPLAQAGRFAFGNLIIHTGSASNAFVNGIATGFGVLGDFTVNSGEFRTSNVLYLDGNLTVNSDGTLTATTLQFANYANATASAATAAQEVTNNGTIRNSSSVPSANFQNLNINNGNGVTFNNNFSFVGMLGFVATPSGPSRIYMANGAILTDKTSQSPGGATTGWVVGKYERTVTGGTLTFPIGDSNIYAPMQVSASNITTTGTVVASTSSGIHPDISSIGNALNTQQTVKRYYSVATNNLTASGITLTFQFQAVDATEGNTAGFKVARYNSGLWTYPATGTPSFSAPLYSVPGTGLTDATITGQYIIASACTTPEIIMQPLAQNVCPNTSLSFNVFATGDNLRYQWRKGTVNIPSAESATYNIASVQGTDAGNYNVVISGACGATLTSADATLAVGDLAPPITTQPASSQTICTGKPVTFTVAATGTGLTYQWYKGTVAINQATSPSYTIPNVAMADIATYSVKVASSCNIIATSGNAQLIVNTTPATPAITNTRPSVFCTGDSTVLHASAAAGTYQWSVNGTGVGGNTASFIAKSSGNYVVTVTNNGCSATSAQVAVTAHTLPSSAITPAGPVVVCVPANVVLSATPGGTTYQWYKDATPINNASSSAYTTTISGAYTVLISDVNNCKALSMPVSVTVNPQPSVVVTANGPTAFCTRDSVTLSIPAVMGIAYQWQRNKENIRYSLKPVNTASYAAATGGDYRVAATIIATGCSDTSSETHVVVKPELAAFITPDGPTTFCEGDSVVLHAVTGMGYTYQWMQDGNNIQGATTPSYKTKIPAQYAVAITNTDACTTVSPVTRVAVNRLPTPVIIQNGFVLSVSGGGMSFQWYLNGQPIQGATAATYTPAVPGDYSVMVTNGNSCSGISAVKNVSVVGVPAVVANTNVVIYPNPSVNVVHIDAPININVRISSLDGRELMYKINAKDIDVSSMANAVYIISITDANGIVIKNEKLVKRSW